LTTRSKEFLSIELKKLLWVVYIRWIATVMFIFSLVGN